MQKTLHKLRYRTDEIEWRARARRYLIYKFFERYFNELPCSRAGGVSAEVASSSCGFIPGASSEVFARKNKSNKGKIKVLDLGCGTGFLQYEMEKKFENIEAYGLDISTEAIKLAKKRGLKRVITYPGKTLPFEDNFFDLIIAADVLEHIKDDLYTLKEIRRTLKKNGKAIFSVPSHSNFWSDRDLMLHHFRRYDKDELELKCKRVKFQILQSNHVDFTLYFIFWFLLKKAPKWEGIKKIGWETARVNPILNQLLYLYQILEYQLLNFFSYPLGLSKIVIVEK